MSMAIKPRCAARTVRKLLVPDSGRHLFPELQRLLRTSQLDVSWGDSDAPVGSDDLNHSPLTQISDADSAALLARRLLNRISEEYTVMSRFSFSRQILGAIVVVATVHAQPGTWPSDETRQDTYDLTRLGVGKEATVIVVFSEQCVECTAALPFYKRLLSLPKMDGTVRRFVVVAPEGVVPASDAIAAAGLKPHRISSGPSPAAPPLPVKSMPAVIVLDAGGKIAGTWEGKLSASKETTIVTLIEQSRAPDIQSRSVPSK